MSAEEQQGFLARRESTRVDTQPVEGAQPDDLDPTLVAAWCSTVRVRDAEGLGRFDDEQMLIHAGIRTREGIPTVAGVLALGLYPQQFFPMCLIRAASLDAGGAIRATHEASLTGPIPTMITRAVTWAEQTFAHVVQELPSGHVDTRPEYPLLAFREVIANALIHRDYHEWCLGSAVEVRHYSDQLVVYNPGGLFGVSTEQLGRFPISSSRNPMLLNICKYLPLATGGNVVEALAEGIPTIARELSQAHLPPVIFDDSGIRFSVRLRNHSFVIRQHNRVLDTLTGRQQTLLRLIGEGVSTIPQLATAIGAAPPNIRRSMSELLERGLVRSEQVKGQRAYVYRADDPDV